MWRGRVGGERGEEKVKLWRSWSIYRLEFKIGFNEYSLPLLSSVEPKKVYFPFKVQRSLIMHVLLIKRILRSEL